MDFTRAPIIETVITPREGAKLVVRSSKSSGQEEYFVDAVEVVAFGSAIFFRSTEKPKSFLVPATDYEVLEVREARIVLKNVGNVGSDRSIKIAGGRDAAVRAPKEPEEEKTEASTESSEAQDARQDRKKERRRQGRRRRGREEMIPPPLEGVEGVSEKPLLPVAEGSGPEAPSPEMLASLLSPPPLISETINRYKEQFKDAFYTKEEQEKGLTMAQPQDIQTSPLPEIALMQPAFGSFESTEEDEEVIYRQRIRKGTEEQVAPETPEGDTTNVTENPESTV